MCAPCTMAAISFEEAKAYRTRILARSDLIEDWWDLSANHIALVRAGQIVATYRLVRPVCGRLPVNDHIADLAVSNNDRQVGRFVTMRSSWTKQSAIVFFELYREALASIKGTVYVATAEWG